MAGAADLIKVAVRLRPITDRERAAGSSVFWNQKENSVVQIDPVASRPWAAAEFHFDSVFGVTARNIDVYNGVVAPIVESAMRGFNGTIFAYGQTGTGKTHTILGTEEESGIIRLAINDIFRMIETSDRNFCMRASYFEIYNEKIEDLLSGADDLEKKKKSFVPKLTEKPVTSFQEVVKLLKDGERKQ